MNMGIGKKVCRRKEGGFSTNCLLHLNHAIEAKKGSLRCPFVAFFLSSYGGPVIGMQFCNFSCKYAVRSLNDLRLEVSCHAASSCIFDGINHYNEGNGVRLLGSLEENLTLSVTPYIRSAELTE